MEVISAWKSVYGCRCLFFFFQHVVQARNSVSSSLSESSSTPSKPCCHFLKESKLWYDKDVYMLLLTFFVSTFWTSICGFRDLASFEYSVHFLLLCRQDHQLKPFNIGLNLESSYKTGLKKGIDLIKGHPDSQNSWKSNQIFPRL